MLTRLRGADHFAMYTNFKSLCCTPEVNMLYVNYTSIKTNEQRTKTKYTEIGKKSLSLSSSTGT